MPTSVGVREKRSEPKRVAKRAERKVGGRGLDGQAVNGRLGYLLSSHESTRRKGQDRRRKCFISVCQSNVCSISTLTQSIHLLRVPTQGSVHGRLQIAYSFLYRPEDILSSVGTQMIRSTYRSPFGRMPSLPLGRFPTRSATSTRPGRSQSRPFQTPGSKRAPSRIVPCCLGPEFVGRSRRPAGVGRYPCWRRERSRSIRTGSGASGAECRTRR